MTVVGAWRLGVTWDEPIHVERLRNFLDSGWYLAEGQLQQGKPTPGMDQQYVYGPVAMLLLHALTAITGMEGWGSVSATAHAYAVRHVGVALISVGGLVAVATTARMILRRWDWGVVAAAVLAATPLWTGHAMFNMKDVPVGTGYALVTLGLCAIARDVRTARWYVRIGGPVALGAGTVLALGTRPGMWTAVAASCGALCLCRWIRSGDRRLGLRNDWWRYRDGLVALATAWVVLVYVDPEAFGSPVTMLVKSATGSANFLGVMAPRTYVPLHVLVQVPVVILVFFVIGLYITIRLVLRTRTHIAATETRLILVVVQVVTLPGITVIHPAALYGDLRQLLFASPGTAIIATVGIAHTVRCAQRAKDPGVAKLAVALAAAALILPTLDQATLFPYNYAYYNPLSKVARLDLSGDYYRASGREIVPMLPASGRFVCSPQAVDDQGRVGRMAHLDGWVDCSNSVLSPISAYATSREWTNAPTLAPDEFWALSFNNRAHVPGNCGSVKKITRWTVWRTMLIASLWRCKLAYPTVSPRAISFEKLSGVPQLPDLGWVITGVDNSKHGISTFGTSSSFTFKLSRAFAGHGAIVTLRTSHDVDAAASFGGIEVNVRRLVDGQSGIEIELPDAAVTRAISTATTLELRGADSQPLDVSVLSFEAEPAD